MLSSERGKVALHVLIESEFFFRRDDVSEHNLLVLFIPNTRWYGKRP